jgi:hypothetical protein
MQFNNPPGKIKNNMTTPHLQKSIGRSPSRLALLLIPLVFACFTLVPQVQAEPKTSIRDGTKIQEGKPHTGPYKKNTPRPQKNPHAHKPKATTSAPKAK